jgi:hypothetical protein
MELYEKMLPSNLPCVMTVAISKPLTRQQGELLNNQRLVIKDLIADAIAAPMGMVSDQGAGWLQKWLASLCPASCAIITLATLLWVSMRKSGAGSALSDPHPQWSFMLRDRQLDDLLRPVIVFSVPLPIPALPDQRQAP